MKSILRNNKKNKSMWKYQPMNTDGVLGYLKCCMKGVWASQHWPLSKSSLLVCLLFYSLFFFSPGNINNAFLTYCISALKIEKDNVAIQNSRAGQNTPIVDSIFTGWGAVWSCYLLKDVYVFHHSFLPPNQRHCHGRQSKGPMLWLLCPKPFRSPLLGFRVVHAHTHGDDLSQEDKHKSPHHVAKEVFSDCFCCFFPSLSLFFHFVFVVFASPAWIYIFCRHLTGHNTKCLLTWLSDEVRISCLLLTTHTQPVKKCPTQSLKWSVTMTDMYLQTH